MSIFYINNYDYCILFSVPGINPVPESYGEILPLPKTAVTNASFYLEHKLLNGYSRRAIPNQNQSQPFVINTDITLYQLLELVRNKIFFQQNHHYCYCNSYCNYTVSTQIGK